MEQSERQERNDMSNKRAHLKLLQMLEDELQPEELVQDVVYGEASDPGDVGGPPTIVALTARRVVAMVKHRLSSTTCSWSYDQITAVATGKGLLTGQLVFTVPGDSFILKRIPKGDAEHFRHEVEERIHAPATPAVADPNPHDRARRLKDLERLRHQELISAEEFEAKRQEILSSL
jgi:hypothetical protein